MIYVFFINIHIYEKKKFAHRVSVLVCFSSLYRVSALLSKSLRCGWLFAYHPCCSHVASAVSVTTRAAPAVRMSSMLPLVSFPSSRARLTLLYYRWLLLFFNAGHFYCRAFSSCVMFICFTFLMVSHILLTYIS